MNKTHVQKLFNKNLIIKISVISLLLIIISLIIILVFFNDKSIDNKDENTALFYNALKINGQMIGEKSFYDKYKELEPVWKSDPSMFEITQEERNDMLLEEVIIDAILKDFVYNKSGAKVSKEEFETYYKKTIKTKYSTEDKLSMYLLENNFQDENELKKTIEFYLLRLQCIPDIAKEYGIELSDEEINKIDFIGGKKNIANEENQDLINDQLMKKFSKSKQYREWILKLKEDTKIEILEPSMYAYQLYKQKNYSEAAKYYKKAYEKYNSEEFLKKYKECKTKS